MTTDSHLIYEAYKKVSEFQINKSDSNDIVIERSQDCKTWWINGKELSDVEIIALTKKFKLI